MDSHLTQKLIDSIDALDYGQIVIHKFQGQVVRITTITEEKLAEDLDKHEKID